MAVTKLYNGKYQARVEGPDGRYLTRVFRTKSEAIEQEAKWKQMKRDGQLADQVERQITLDHYFQEWISDVEKSIRRQEDTGWLGVRKQLYRDYIAPAIGRYKLRAITPQMVKRVLNAMAEKGKAPQTRVHVFGMLRKMFNDAIEDYRYMTFNPALRKFKPKVPVKETPHLGGLEQIRRLLTHVNGKKYDLAIWVQLYLGLRIGELQALRWEDVDLESGRAYIRRTYVRKKGVFRDYPKGKRHLVLSLPPELWRVLANARKSANSVYVACTKDRKMIPYEGYFRTLRRYCREAGVPVIGTHGLRHSTSTLYRSHGASKDDMQQLFAHSDPSVTARYLHGSGTHLERVVNTIRLFESQDASAFWADDKKSETNKKRTKLALVRF